MSDRPAGRRDNGLSCSDWGALVDLDPRLAEGLLDRLASAGVAAYVEPAGATDPFSRAPLPSRPLDRLWVDPARAQQAREVVSAEVADLSALLAESDPGATAHGLVHPVPRHAVRRVLTPPVLPPSPRATTPPPPAGPADAAAGSTPAAAPGPPGPGSVPPPASTAGGPGPAGPAAGFGERPDDDEVFRQIVAGFSTTSDDPVPRWPVQEDGTDGTDLAARRRRPPPVDRSPRPTAGPALPGWLEPDALEPDPDDDVADDHFVPPPPPPVPRVSLRTVGAVLTLVLGLVLVFVPGSLGQTETPGTLLLGVALLVGGAAGLVHRVRDAPGTGPDDGAVV